MATPSNISRENSKEPGQTAVALVQLEKQVERSQFFAHSALSENYVRLAELEAFIYGLIDTLLAKGLIGESELLASIHKVRTELSRRNELNGPRTVVRVDNPNAESFPPVLVDCNARMHICRAVCCKLDFALSIPEIESHNIKWDLGRPYFIRHDAHSCCVHLDASTGKCSVYSDRPGVCKGYSCANDSRIWKDFEKMELNQEWIDNNLTRTTEPFVVKALMHSPDQLQDPEALENIVPPQGEH
jgi:Fe-S-cluster containining protein